MTAILDLPLNINLITHAIEKEQEQAVWEMWIARYPWMSEDNFISFSDFKDSLLKPSIKSTNKSLEEIEKEMINIVENYENKKGSVTTSKN